MVLLYLQVDFCSSIRISNVTLVEEKKNVHTSLLLVATLLALKGAEML